ncbi:arginine--tRNA ligase [Dictyobacter arantiisoli]|uniref:arginine--tRNA ligase n=1 Tax=Dictyobacter arantiisoli TaxID=2014874 RepID=A0A5A5T7M1_9CHLR|nr:arginine--tRNA ligase [Dictyobacter arantiisoli]GCF07407.1 arginine--tRNA ligase [Dictyobacter arantiisoli]
MTVSSEAQFMTDSTPQDIHTYITGIMQQAVATYLEQEQSSIDATQLPIDLRLSAQASFGDYSIPVMAWSGKLKRPPLKIAEAMQTILQANSQAVIQEITATKPGYLNFRLNRPVVGQQIIDRVLEAGADFGQQTLGIGTKVIVEHTNINSNKAAHVGHLRNSCIGDTVVRMLRSQGYQVEADNYIDDSGVQVADVVVGFEMLKKGLVNIPGGNEQQADESFDYYCSRVYTTVSKIYDEKETEQGQMTAHLRKEVLHAIEHGEKSASGTNYPVMAAELSHKIVQAHLKTMSRLNISYDILPWESAILHAGLWQHTFEMLKSRGLLEKPETGHAAGCWILPFGDGDTQTNEGDRSSDKILVRSDGTATYTAKDIAYQLWKFGLADQLGVDFHFVPWGIQYDGRKLWTMRTPHDPQLQIVTDEAPTTKFGHAKRVINVIDVRQSYLQQVVYESLRRLGYEEQADNSKHLAYEVVTLSAATAAQLGIDTSDGREYYAMSGRKGIEIKADDLINAAIARMQEVRKQDNKADLPPETATLLAASAIRYFMIRFNLQQIITLDMDDVLRPNGDTGVYLQYAYARANSILRRLQDAGYEIPARLEQLPAQLEQSEWDLLRHIDVYPRRLAEYTEQLAPSLLASYAYDLAAHFSDFYEHTPPMLKETDEQVKAFRAFLVQATTQTMGNVLRVLGFKPLERI